MESKVVVGLILVVATIGGGYMVVSGGCGPTDTTIASLDAEDGTTDGIEVRGEITDIDYEAQTFRIDDGTGIAGVSPYGEYRRQIEDLSCMTVSGQADSGMNASNNRILISFGSW